MVIWGHEHDCLISPQEVPGKGYFISQPGSSVATSLAQGESLKKHVGILVIQDRDFSLIPIPLKTVRPFIFRDIVLAEEEEEHRLKLDSKPKVVKYLQKLVEDLIKKSNEEWDAEHADDSDETPRMLPLVRLRVEYTRPDGETGYEVGNPQRFGQDFLGKVANPKDLVQFHRRRKIGTRKPKNDIDLPEDNLIFDSQGRVTNSEKIQVSALVNQYLEAQSLSVLAENGMQEAVTLFVEKDDKDAIKDFYNDALKASQARIKESDAQFMDQGGRRRDKAPESEDEEIREQLARAKENYAVEWEKNQDRELRTQRGKEKSKSTRHRRRNDDDSDESDFGRMSNEERIPEPDDSDPQEPSDSEISVQMSVPKKKAPPKKSATSAPPKKAPPKRATTKPIAASSRSKTSRAQTQATLDFSSQVPVRGASSRSKASTSKKTQRTPSDSDESPPRRNVSRSRR